MSVPEVTTTADYARRIVNAEFALDCQAERITATEERLDVQTERIDALVKQFEAIMAQHSTVPADKGLPVCVSCERDRATLLALPCLHVAICQKCMWSPYPDEDAPGWRCCPACNERIGSVIKITTA